MSSNNSNDDQPHGPSNNHLSENGSGVSDVSQVAEDDPHKVEKLTKAGRDLDPDEGTE